MTDRRYTLILYLWVFTFVAALLPASPLWLRSIAVGGWVVTCLLLWIHSEPSKGEK